MRHWLILLTFVTGCVPMQLVPPEPATQQVAVSPFSEGRKAMPIRVNLPPPNQELAYQVELVRGKLVGENLEKTGLRPNVVTLGAQEPEIFHVGLSQIYITEGLVRRCETEGQLAALLAYEMGRMVAEREAGVSEHVRNPERLPPIAPPIGDAGIGMERDPVHQIELARYYKNHPRQSKKLTPPNPQAVARAALERAGYARTDLDAALPLLQVAERGILQDQFKGTINQGDWKAR